MPVKIGNYRIPKTRLGILLDHLIVLEKDFHKNPFDRNQFADILKLSETSSGPDSKILDLLLLRLIEQKENGIYNISSLGMKIIKNSGIDKSNMIEESIRHVPLWDILLEKIGTKTIDDERFQEILININVLTKEQLKKQFYTIKFAYYEDIRCITAIPPYSTWTPRTSKKSKITEKQMKIYEKPTSTSQTTSVTSQTWVFQLSSDIGDITIEIFDETTYNLALTILNSIKDQITNKSLDKTEDPTMGS